MSSHDGETNGGTLRYRVGELEKAVANLTQKVERLVFVILTLSLTIAGAAVTFALTYAGSR